MDPKKETEATKGVTGVTIILNMKVMLIEIKNDHLKNILIKLDHIQKTS